MPVGAGCDNLPGRCWQALNQRRSAPLPRPPSGPLDDPRIRALHHALERERPRLIGQDEEVARAAVALLARPSESDVELLFIERPHSERDPWSGHIAFPGGRKQANESDVDTAMRETKEEVGVDLLATGVQIGRLDDVRPSRGGPQIAVAAFVFAIPATTRPVPDPAEVATVLWVPMTHLTDPASAAEHLHPFPDGRRMSFPAVSYGGYVIWGLTYRIMTQFLQIARAADGGSRRE